jgi:hypothetical protein
MHVYIILMLSDNDFAIYNLDATSPTITGGNVLASFEHYVGVILDRIWTAMFKIFIRHCA